MDIIGKKFGRLTVIEYDGKDGNSLMVKCRCECGNYTRTRVSRLMSGHTRSCGCYRKDMRTKHGQTHTRLYFRWCNMRRRCNEPTNKWYKAYGGRGIKVCNEWESSFESFYKWAYSNGYNDSLTLDRIDNNGNYEPDNCRWVSPVEQANNRRSSHYLEYQGKTMTIAQWAKHTGISYHNISRRLQLNWPIEEVLGYKKHIVQKNETRKNDN